MGAKREDITEALILEILADMSVGASLSDACKRLNVPVPTIWQRIQKSSELYKEYCRARERRADAVFERMEELEGQVLKGKINPKAFHAVSRSMQWRLGKMKPKDYADRHTVEHTGKINVASEIATARRRAIIESVEDAEIIEEKKP